MEKTPSVASLHHDGLHLISSVEVGSNLPNFPIGGEEVKIGDQTYMKVGETYYQSVKIDGKPKYEVAQVEQASK